MRIFFKMNYGTQCQRTRVLSPLLVLLTISISATFFGCSAASQSNAGSAPPPVPMALVTLCDDGSPACTPAVSFSLGAVRDISVQVAWSGLEEGNHVQQLDIQLPGGGLYQTVQTGFLATASSNGAAAQTARLFPVAGTSIAQRNITGSWNLVVSLDGQQFATQPFQITQ